MDEQPNPSAERVKWLPVVVSLDVQKSRYLQEVVVVVHRALEQWGVPNVVPFRGEMYAT